jgi:hypothetical protein
MSYVPGHRERDGDNEYGYDLPRDRRPRPSGLSFPGQGSQGAQGLGRLLRYVIGSRVLQDLSDCRRRRSLSVRGSGLHEYPRRYRGVT